MKLIKLNKLESEAVIFLIKRFGFNQKVKEIENVSDEAITLAEELTIKANLIAEDPDNPLMKLVISDHEMKIIVITTLMIEKALTEQMDLELFIDSLTRSYKQNLSVD